MVSTMDELADNKEEGSKDKHPGEERVGHSDRW